MLLGKEKFGWLKRLLPRAMKSKCNRSVSWKRFRMVRLLLMMPGPSRMLMPEFPNLPMLAGFVAGFEQVGFESGQPGIVNALVLNQSLTERMLITLCQRLRSAEKAMNG